MSKSGKRSHSRRGKEYSVSEDSESSASSNEGDLRAKKTKEKQSRRRSGETRRGRSVEEHRSKRERKVSGEKKSKKKRRRKGTPEMLERRDSVPLHQAKELQAKRSCLDFISSTRITPTAVSVSVGSEKVPSVSSGSAVESMQRSSGSDAQRTERLVV